MVSSEQMGDNGQKVKEKEFHLSILFFFHSEGGQTLKHVAQRGHGRYIQPCIEPRGMDKMTSRGPCEPQSLYNPGLFLKTS